MKSIIAMTPQSIVGILHFVHDRFFALSKIQFDKDAQTLLIPLTVISDEQRDQKRILFVKTWNNPIVEATLLIKNVHDYSVKDEAQVDEGDINAISKEGTCVVIKCGLPVEIRAEVTALAIELVLSDTIVSRKMRFSFS